MPGLRMPTCLTLAQGELQSMRDLPEMPPVIQVVITCKWAHCERGREIKQREKKPKQHQLQEKPWNLKAQTMDITSLMFWKPQTKAGHMNAGIPTSSVFVNAQTSSDWTQKSFEHWASWRRPWAFGVGPCSTTQWHVMKDELQSSSTVNLGHRHPGETPQLSQLGCSNSHWDHQPSHWLFQMCLNVKVPW